MKDDSKFQLLGINDIELLDSKQGAVAETYYKAVITPTHPGINKPGFTASRGLYFGSKDTFSVIGQYFDWENKIFEIISFVFNRSLGDDTYPVGGVGSKVQGLLTMGVDIGYARNGEMTFKRNLVNNSITATFNFDIEHGGTTFSVSDGKIFLYATGPL